MISYKNITLRPICESDIENYIRWTSIEPTEDWEDPWDEDEAQFVEMQRKRLDKNPAVHRWLEIDTDDSTHIGWVNSYSADWDKSKIAVGLVIAPIPERRRGRGEAALTLFMAYLFNRMDIEEIYTETWSGNHPMCALAKRIGFAEVGRSKNVREINGQIFDNIAFAISRKDFFAKYVDIVS